MAICVAVDAKLETIPNTRRRTKESETCVQIMCLSTRVNFKEPESMTTARASDLQEDGCQIPAISIK